MYWNDNNQASFTIHCCSLRLLLVAFSFILYWLRICLHTCTCFNAHYQEISIQTNNFENDYIYIYVYVARIFICNFIFCCCCWIYIYMDSVIFWLWMNCMCVLIVHDDNNDGRGGFNLNYDIDFNYVFMKWLLRLVMLPKFKISLLFGCNEI